MWVYNITRTRLVTERFRVIADTEEEALQTLADEMDLPQVTEYCELLEQSTASSELEFGEVEQHA